MEAKPITMRTLVFSFLVVLPFEVTLRLTSLGFSFTGAGLIRLVQIGLLLWIVAASAGGVASMGLESDAWRRGLRRGLFWCLGFGAAVSCAFLVFYMAGIDIFPMIRVSLPREVETLVLLFIVGGVIAPVAEEIFFRGVLYGFFRRWGFAFALILTTFFFVVSHPLGRDFPIIQIVGGLIFAISYEMERTLFVPITIHMLGNLTLFVLAVLLGK
jgi:uncharacterized protein